ncbi:hypothetical protein H4R33_006172 [Dimargaris cristalligena]|uniref:Uncharacterized protein n=1 Tax=Dimargaris cristalligena TaxID=215637 RepID=A0A4P9ZUP5_9FUNG|nr:hypothetical protein H4R33_006172 [Dimargaris cristalligena]RKP36978.1 hypothetical protein BJ085DRAFT_41217 [Dimargaris cristalligena]|eukprot:RKP36978.1 hypothetical protein BJ085DRAFT_41217 [Dimargaris cristalligena]
MTSTNSADASAIRNPPPTPSGLSIVDHSVHLSAVKLECTEQSSTEETAIDTASLTLATNCQLSLAPPPSYTAVEVLSESTGDRKLILELESSAFVGVKQGELGYTVIPHIGLVASPPYDDVRVLGLNDSQWDIVIMVLLSINAVLLYLKYT